MNTRTIGVFLLGGICALALVNLFRALHPQTPLVADCDSHSQQEQQLQQVQPVQPQRPEPIKFDPSCRDIASELPNPVVFVQVDAVKAPFQITAVEPERDRVISKWLIKDGNWDVHVLKAIERVAAEACRRSGSGNGALAMDVGANLGFFTNAMLAMGCRVASFEMQPEMIRMAKLSACINGFSSRLT